MTERSATGQDREFEMVLDNKKLFSILFLTFVLLGVFFAMGYMLGRNSAPLEAVATTVPGEPVTPAPRPAASGGPVEITPSQTAEPTAPQAAASEVPAQPARTEPPPAAGTIIEPRAGQTFLQVSAVARPEAELLVDVLVKKGFRAAVAPGPNESLYRVLVGPAASDTELAKLKGDLEQAGFKPIPRRY